MNNSSQVLLGSWIHRIDHLKKEFNRAKPFSHVVIEDFFSEKVAEMILENFPHPTASCARWHHYDNPIEQKYSLDDFSQLPEIEKVVQLLQSDEVVELFKKVTGIVL